MTTKTKPCPDCAHTEHPGQYWGAFSQSTCETCGGSAEVASGPQIKDYAVESLSMSLAGADIGTGTTGPTVKVGGLPTEILKFDRVLTSEEMLDLAAAARFGQDAYTEKAAELKSRPSKRGQGLVPDSVEVSPIGPGSEAPSISYSASLPGRIQPVSVDAPVLQVPVPDHTPPVGAVPAFKLDVGDAFSVVGEDGLRVWVVYDKMPACEYLWAVLIHGDEPNRCFGGELVCRTSITRDMPW